MKGKKMKSIHVVEESLPMAWEKAVIRCWEEGDSFPTQYDKENDPNSRDVTALIHITNPMQEPRIHKALPMGLNDLEKYRSEILYGVHDYYMDDVTNENRWSYTYHQRLFDYDGVNQMDKVIEMLKKCGFTRRAQAVTWQPQHDLEISDPPCLQSLLFRVQDKNKLNMSVRFRSQDLFKAFASNTFALTELQKFVADEVGVEVGSCMCLADSMHIYGSYFDELDGFMSYMGNTKFEDRVFDTQFAIPMYIDGCDELLKESGLPEDKRLLVIKRKEYLKNMLST